MSSDDPHGHGSSGHAHESAPPAPSGPPTDWVMVRNVSLLIVLFVAVATIVATVSCRSAVDPVLQREAGAFLDSYNQTFRELTTASQEAEWQVNAKIVEGDDTSEKASNAAKEKLAAFQGSQEVVDTCRKFLADEKKLDPLQARELRVILYLAGDKPAVAKELVSQRIAAETAQVKKLFGFQFMLPGADGKAHEVSTNEIDHVLREEKDLAKRQQAWETSKAVGATLKDGLADLQRLRNGTVRALGYSDFFSYMVAPFDMTTDEMLALNDQTLRQLRPLFRELHTYWRYELAKRYGQPVPDLIPAHWLPNRWAQEWSELLQVPGVDLDGALKDKSPEWVVHQAEKFYVSLGFEPLPKSFWEKSSLYPVPADAGFKKNNHATAWHIDLDHDVRSLMSVENDSEWYQTTHHELGHIYYYLSYSRPEVPMVLRDGASPAFHEGIGTMIGLAAMQPRFVKAIGLEASSGGAKPDPIQMLHKDALFYIVFAPFSSGTMLHFEHELYAKELPKAQWNRRWWELVAKYQGVAPPTARGEEFCDAATKTHINDNPAQYYKYALANVFLMQVHDHIAREILHEDPHDTNYFGRKEVGDFLKTLLSPGATQDWRKLMKEKVGGELSADAMMRYFAPLMSWLQEQNKGRKHTLPDV
jgi:peptidyl-dipeptidase A